MLINLKKLPENLAPRQIVEYKPFPQNLSLYLAPIKGYLGPNKWLAGGALNRFMEHELRLFHPADVSKGDWDLFVLNPEQVREELLKNPNMVQTNESMWTWTFSEGWQGKPIQLIKLSYLDAQQVIDGFDFTARQWITDGTTLWCGHRTEHDMLERKIIYNPLAKFPITDSVTSLSGMMKYANRGYELDNVEAREFMKRFKEEPILEPGQGY